MRIVHTAAITVALLATTAAAALAKTAPASPRLLPPVIVQPLAPQFLTARQFNFGCVDYAYHPATGGISKQFYTAWRVQSGRWDGQTLDGLLAVLVVDRPQNVWSPAHETLYVSLDATPAQRQAMVDAVEHANPRLFGEAPLSPLTVSPAYIRIDTGPGSGVVLHLGKIS